MFNFKRAARENLKRNQQVSNLEQSSNNKNQNEIDFKINNQQLVRVFQRPMSQVEPLIESQQPIVPRLDNIGELANNKPIKTNENNKLITIKKSSSQKRRSSLSEQERVEKWRRSQKLRLELKRSTTEERLKRTLENHKRIEKANEEYNKKKIEKSIQVN